MVLQKIILQIVLDNKDIGFVLFVLNIIYRVLRRDQLYHNLGLSIISNLLFRAGLSLSLSLSLESAFYFMNRILNVQTL